MTQTHTHASKDSASASGIAPGFDPVSVSSAAPELCLPIVRGSR